MAHSLRHAMRDRLHAAGYPSENIDQIGGWSKRSVGEGYGEVYSTSQLRSWMLNLDKTIF